MDFSGIIEVMTIENSQLFGADKIAFIHVPKTGGSSMRAFWVDLFGPDQVIRYSIDTGWFHRMSDRWIIPRTNPAVYLIRNILVNHEAGRQVLKFVRTLERVKSMAKAFDKLPDDFRVVHGHFSPSFIRGRLPELRLTTVIRDPLERTISGYFFLEKMAKHKNIKLPPWYKKGMGLEAFAFLPEMVNYQFNFIEGDLSVFDLIGTTPYLECFCRHFDPNGTIPIPWLNDTDRPKLTLSADFLSRFRKTNADDYALYEEATRIALSR